MWQPPNPVGLSSPALPSWTACCLQIPTSTVEKFQSEAYDGPNHCLPDPLPGLSPRCLGRYDGARTRLEEDSDRSARSRQVRFQYFRLPTVTLVSIAGYCTVCSGSENTGRLRLSIVKVALALLGWRGWTRIGSRAEISYTRDDVLRRWLKIAERPRGGWQIIPEWTKEAHFQASRTAGSFQRGCVPQRRPQ